MHRISGVATPHTATKAETPRTTRQKQMLPDRWRVRAGANPAVVTKCFINFHQFVLMT